MSIWVHNIIYSIEKSRIGDIKLLLFQATNEVSLGENKSMIYFKELLKMIFRLTSINLI
jgi:hypothetical protein